MRESRKPPSFRKVLRADAFKTFFVFGQTYRPYYTYRPYRPYQTY